MPSVGTQRRPSAQLVGGRAVVWCNRLLAARLWTEKLVSVLKSGARPFQSVAYRATYYTSPHPLYNDAWTVGAFVPAAHAMQVTGQCVTDNLELLIAEMARHQAHHHQYSLAAATRQIRALVTEAREEYRAAGAPYGDEIKVSVVGCSQNHA